jgi:hypothetical protein
MFAWGGGGRWRICATRDDEPRPVRGTRAHAILRIRELCVCLLLQCLLLLPGLENSMRVIELVLYFFYCGRNSMRNLAGIQLYLHLLIFELSRTSEGSSGGMKKGMV